LKKNGGGGGAARHQQLPLCEDRADNVQQRSREMATAEHQKNPKNRCAHLDYF